MKTKIKMRFWQKAYLLTLALFLICLDGGVLSLTVYTHSKNVEAAENTASAEQKYVAMSFERDLEDVTNDTSYGSRTLLMQSYCSYYAKNGVRLAFEEGGETVYSSLKEIPDISAGSMMHTDIDGERHIVISSEICEGEYVMIFAKNVETLDTEFHSLMLTYAVTAVGVSLFLAVCLFFVLKKLSAPLEKLRATTEKTRAGDFSARAEEKGSDEFGLLAKSFNLMLVRINEQMDDLAREAERKQMLVDNMAHELRTPLTSIHGYAEYLEKANTSTERRLIAARYIMSESERLQKISEILLDGAFIRENRAEMTEVDLGAILSDVCEGLRMRAEQSGVDIVCDTANVTVVGNETLLSMLFYNLAENAIKACSVGGRVWLSCGDGRAEVEDNGKGMTEEQLLHITEPFYRVDKSRSRAEGGAGLGLALCRQIADVHGAELVFESKIGVGTKISVIFTSRQ